MVLILSFCACVKSEPEVDWGSFTWEKTFSYDEKFYAVQEVQEIDDVNFIIVSVYSSDDELVSSFAPARASDFYGICWEEESYNIWIQSGDIGVLCYAYGNGEWNPDYLAVRPEYIVSKYDNKE